MLLTSGVIRSATVDPPYMATSQPQIGSQCILSPQNPGFAQLIHSTDRAHRMGVLAHCHNTFVDILKEFGRR